MALLDTLLGRPLATHEEGEQRVGTLGSASYGPEAVLTLLIPLGMLGVVYLIPISALIIALLIIVYLSYYSRQW